MKTLVIKNLCFTFVNVLKGRLSGTSTILICINVNVNCTVLVMSAPHMILTQAQPMTKAMVKNLKQN